MLLFHVDLELHSGIFKQCHTSMFSHFTMFVASTDYTPAGEQQMTKIIDANWQMKTMPNYWNIHKNTSSLYHDYCLLAFMCAFIHQILTYG
jgi:hypothetical protein